MTEDEACVTQCCGGDGCGYVNPDDNIRYCVASRCMGWRWERQEFDRPTELWSKSKGRRVNSAYSDDADWRPVVGASPDEPPPGEGHCGLVARP